MRVVFGYSAQLKTKVQSSFILCIFVNKRFSILFYFFKLKIYLSFHVNQLILKMFNVRIWPFHSSRSFWWYRRNKRTVTWNQNVCPKLCMVAYFVDLSLHLDNWLRIISRQVNKFYYKYIINTYSTWLRNVIREISRLITANRYETTCIARVKFYTVVCAIANAAPSLKFLRKDCTVDYKTTAMILYRVIIMR